MTNMDINDDDDDNNNNNNNNNMMMPKQTINVIDHHHHHCCDSIQKHNFGIQKCQFLYSNYSEFFDDDDDENSIINIISDSVNDSSYYKIIDHHHHPHNNDNDNNDDEHHKNVEQQQQQQQQIMDMFVTRFVTNTNHCDNHDVDDDDDDDQSEQNKPKTTKTITTRSLSLWPSSSLSSLSTISTTYGSSYRFHHHNNNQSESHHNNHGNWLYWLQLCSVIYNMVGFRWLIPSSFDRKFISSSILSLFIIIIIITESMANTTTTTTSLMMPQSAEALISSSSSSSSSALYNSMKKYSTNIKQQQQQQQQEQQQQSHQQQQQKESIIDHYFLIKPNDIYVIEGDSTELKCQINPDIDNYGPVQWSKDGFLLGYEAIIPGHDRYIMLVNQTQRTYNLHIQNVQLEDEAEFECQTTSASSLSSSTMMMMTDHHQQQQQQQNKQPIRASAKLHLIIPPKVIYINSTRSFDNPNHDSTSTFRPSSSSSSLNITSNNQNNPSPSSSSSMFMIDAYEGEKIIIVCTVPYAKPPPRLKWYRKNIELLPEAAKTTVTKTLLSNRHTMYSIESNLILYPKIDEEYRCQAEHPGLSKPLRAMAMINIYRQPSPPVIDGYKNGDIINYQEKLTLKCTSINGYPPPTIIWYRNGVEIDRQSTIIQQNGRHEVYNTLTIIVDHNDNQAQYTCQVMNSLTTIPLQETITLNVFLFPTKIHIDGPTEVLLSDDNDSQGVPITLECNAHPVSHQPNESKIRWLIDGKDVEFNNNNHNHHHQQQRQQYRNNQRSSSSSSSMINNDDDGNNNNFVQIIKHDQQSWTLRSNLTFVIKNKEPNIRNIACIAYSTNGKFETLSTTHQINVIYPPEMPILLGVENNRATVFVGEIFKCKCVCYGGNPRANLIWLNQNDREISALSTTTGTGISSELVLRPTANDHGQIFRCHVIHPTLLLKKPLEVFFTLHVIFPSDQLNITFPKFIKENDTIKIECTSSPSNPCSTLTLLTTNNHNGNRIMMTDDDNNNDDGDDQQDVHNINNNNDIHVKTISYQEMFPINYLYNNDYDNEIDTSTSSLLKHRQNDKNHGIFFRTNCRQQQKQQQNEHSNLFQPNHNNRNSTTTTLLALSNKIIYMFQVKADDDQTQLSCIANNPMITNHAIRLDRILNVHYKPKFLKISETIELNEWENFQLKILLYSNPSTDSIRMDRIEKMNDNTILDRILISIQPDILLNNLKWENIVDYLKPIPLEWHSKLLSSSLSNNHSSIITLDMINVTRNDYGLYVLRTENSVGYSLMFIRLFIRSISSIDMIRVIVPRKTTVMNQSINNIIKLDNNNTQIEIIELIENNDRNFRIECNVNNGNPSSIIRWTKQFFSKYLQRRQIQIQQQSKLIKNPMNDQHYYYHSNQRLKNMPYLYDYDDYIDDDIDYINFLIDSNLQSNDMFIDWSRSNVTQTILSKNSRQQIANSANNNNHHNTNYSHYNKSLSIHSELAINQVNFADSGIYTCHTLNDSRSIAIRIRHRPRIFVSNNLKKIAANIGEISVKFVCSALAYPNVYFNWTRYISTINDDVNVVVDGGGGGGGVDNNNADDDEIQQQQQKQKQQQSSMIVINNSDDHLSNKYRVILPSTESSSSTTTELEMIIKNYHHTSELIINHLNENDYGIYECIVYNEYGNDYQRFELVRKSYPECPKNLQILNRTNQQIFLRWNSGFNYGHEQSFTIRLWPLHSSTTTTTTNSNTITDDDYDGVGDNSNAVVVVVDDDDDDDSIDSEQPNSNSQIFANISNNYFQLQNLEPNTHYRLLLWATNRLGRSRKSLQLTFQTLSTKQYQQQQQMQNFWNKNSHHHHHQHQQQQPIKPLYAASADEQRLNGLIIINDNDLGGNDDGVDTAASQSSSSTIIDGHRLQNRRLAMVVGEDFVEFTILMGGLIIFLAIISFIMVIFIYWRKRNNDHHHQQQQQSNNNNKKINNDMMINDNKINETEQSENVYNHHHHRHNHTTDNNNNNDHSTRLMMMINHHHHHQHPDNDLHSNTIDPSSSSSSVDVNNSATTYHIIKTTNNNDDDNDNNICNELQQLTATPILTSPPTSSIAMNDYLNHSHLHHHPNHLNYYNNEPNGHHHYLAIATSNDHHHHHHHHPTQLEQQQQQQQYEFPYELTTATINDNQTNINSHHSYHHNQQTGHLIESSSSSMNNHNQSLDKQLQYVLSHQQITNVHLLPDRLEQLTIDSSISPPSLSSSSPSSSHLINNNNNDQSIQMASAATSSIPATYQISFAPTFHTYNDGGDHHHNHHNDSTTYELQSPSSCGNDDHHHQHQQQQQQHYRFNTIQSDNSIMITTTPTTTTTTTNNVMPPKVSFIEPNNNCLSSSTSTKRVKIIQNSTILSPSTTKSIISNPPSTTATTLATLNEEDGDEI